MFDTNSHDPWLRWIVSGPFGGKTTLADNLTRIGVRVAETDATRRALPGFHQELWTAWRPDHPLHAEWKLYDRMNTAALINAVHSGAIVLCHEAPPNPTDLAPFKSAFIWPAGRELRMRVESYLEQCVDAYIAGALSASDLRRKLGRCGAAVNYWADAKSKADRCNMLFRTTEEVWSKVGHGPFIVQSRPAS